MVGLGLLLLHGLGQVGLYCTQNKAHKGWSVIGAQEPAGVASSAGWLRKGPSAFHETRLNTIGVLYVARVRSQRSATQSMDSKSILAVIVSTHYWQLSALPTPPAAPLGLSLFVTCTAMHVLAP